MQIVPEHLQKLIFFLIVFILSSLNSSYKERPTLSRQILEAKEPRIDSSYFRTSNPGSFKPWQLQILTDSNPDSFKPWQFQILTNSSPDSFKSWQIQTLTASNPDRFKPWRLQTLIASNPDKFKTCQLQIMTNSNPDIFKSWQIQTLTASNPDRFKPWQLQVLTNSNLTASNSKTTIVLCSVPSGELSQLKFKVGTQSLARTTFGVNFRYLKL